MIARIRPSGFVHRWEERVYAGMPRILWAQACGVRVVVPAQLTTDFPPDTRRCPVCFPEGAGE